jgi:hypothetical protein
MNNPTPESTPESTPDSKPDSKPDAKPEAASVQGMPLRLTVFPAPAVLCRPDRRRIAFERNGEIVPRSRLADTLLTPAPSPLRIGERSFQSRLLVGTGKYRDFDETRPRSRPAAPRSSRWRSGAPTSARTANEPSLLDALPPSRFTLLPNTAGCYTAEDAVRTLRLARELLDGHDLVQARGARRPAYAVSEHGRDRGAPPRHWS